jgi:hypothetical protein
MSTNHSGLNQKSQKHVKWNEEREGAHGGLIDMHDIKFLIHFYYMRNVKKMSSEIETHGQDDRAGDATKLV